MLYGKTYLDSGERDGRMSSSSSRSVAAIASSTDHLIAQRRAERRPQVQPYPRRLFGTSLVSAMLTYHADWSAVLSSVIGWLYFIGHVSFIASFCYDGFENDVWLLYVFGLSFIQHVTANLDSELQCIHIILSVIQSSISLETNQHRPLRQNRT